MTHMLPELPVSEAVPALLAALEERGSAVLAAPPGAGKTTLVPLHLLNASWRKDGRILVLEPRRLAARASARQMARLIGEEVGETVGYRTRLDTRVSGRTRIEVVTEGIFSRMALADPELPGVAAVLFDEYHERSLEADFGLALALEVKSALREDLRLLVMSATLDVARVSQLMDGATIIESRGRAFPVAIRYRERKPTERIEAVMHAAIVEAFGRETGSILAFLPGQGEIRRTAELLQNDNLKAVIAPLYGDLSAKEQDAAIRPPTKGQRKIVLATAIAETSITIDGIRIVIDSGLQRLPVFEPSTGITRLETVRASRASANQRAGRAGRTEPGIAVRLWREEQTAALPEFTPPQMLASDLSGLILDCAAWGVTDPASMRFIDPPPGPAIAEARSLLQTLGALDEAGHLSEKGRTMRTLGLPVRLAAMVSDAARQGSAHDAAELAVLMSEQGLGGPSIDLDGRWRQFRRASDKRAKSARSLAKRIAQIVGGKNEGETGFVPEAGPFLLSGFSDRVARRRGDMDGKTRFSLANGRGAFVEEHSGLAKEPYIVVADLTGKAASQRILSAARIDAQTIETELADKMSEAEEVTFERDTRSVRGRRVRRLGALIVDQQPLQTPSPDAVADALADGVRLCGIDALPWSSSAKQLRGRLDWLRRTQGEPWPDMSDGALLDCLDQWFLPFQPGCMAFGRIAPESLANGLMSLVPFDLQRDIDRLAPRQFQTPAGSNLAIRYEEDEPVLSVRVQELFGLREHPALANGTVPLVLELLSPAQRPIQKTRDLPGFWAGSWADVRADMRGRYPKHPWPQDPATAEPTRRVKSKSKQ
ncbi:ATP-dependent helicase HrpB [Hoeflea prorocentri]|uniref:ATP-dependent helicase HrpB n=1 Tax=Hoeflea prorocentri TaxID=1922333 RepID=A0A9X3ZIG8_9HYPH|nr:ATP-dependent helicase HrpB [Hoeflea prorocentri]MCY6382902.1 ATP-dependent helicase HrpB [Hoeflea prorocentri]MDA5400702.1 ATP-dependent helicase HrpB [Hoeflea prorocentri]